MLEIDDGPSWQRLAYDRMQQPHVRAVMSIVSEKNDGTRFHDLWLRVESLQNLVYCDTLSGTFSGSLSG